MNTSDVRFEIIKQMKDSLKIITEFEVAQLIKKDKLGDMSFADFENMFISVIDEAKMLLRSENYLRLSEQQLTALKNNYIMKMHTRLKEINDFDILKHDDWKTAIGSLKNNFKSEYNSFMTGVCNYAAIIYASGDKEIQKNLEEIYKSKSEIIELKKELDKVLNSAKTAAGKVGVIEHAHIFANQAKEHLTASWWWMGVTILTGLATLVVAVWSISWFMKDFEQLKVTGYAIQFGITKLVVFSIMYFTLVWVSRNYRSNRHNYIVNKHRQNALSTFKTFVDAVKDDPVTQNVILNKTTDCIFSHEISGYLPKEPESSPGMQQIFEILPKLNGKND